MRSTLQRALINKVLKSKYETIGCDVQTIINALSNDDRGVLDNISSTTIGYVKAILNMSNEELIMQALVCLLTHK